VKPGMHFDYVWMARIKNLLLKQNLDLLKILGLNYSSFRWISHSRL